MLYNNFKTESIRMYDMYEYYFNIKNKILKLGIILLVIYIWL